MVIQAKLFNLRDGFLDEEVVVLAVERIRNIGKRENKHIVELVSIVNFGSDDLVWASVVIGFVSDIVVSSVFALDNPEGLLFVWLESMTKEFLIHWDAKIFNVVIELVDQEGLDMSLTGDDVSILGVNVVGVIIFLDLLLPREES